MDLRTAFNSTPRSPAIIPDALTIGMVLRLLSTKPLFEDWGLRLRQRRIACTNFSSLDSGETRILQIVIDFLRSTYIASYYLTASTLRF